MRQDWAPARPIWGMPVKEAVMPGNNEWEKFAG